MRMLVAVVTVLGVADQPSSPQPSPFHLVEATIDDVRSALASKQLTCRVLVEQYDPTRIASGSSGGTGSGIAANFATIGIGEDTGGSVRGPAAVNNLVGLRPTLPLVSDSG